MVIRNGVMEPLFGESRLSGGVDAQPMPDSRKMDDLRGSGELEKSLSRRDCGDLRPVDIKSY